MWEINFQDSVPQIIVVHLHSLIYQFLTPKDTHKKKKTDAPLHFTEQESEFSNSAKILTENNYL